MRRPTAESDAPEMPSAATELLPSPTAVAPNGILVLPRGAEFRLYHCSYSLDVFPSSELPAQLLGLCQFAAGMRASSKAIPKTGFHWSTDTALSAGKAEMRPLPGGIPPPHSLISNIFT